jgi:hypothetical protein
MNHSESIKELAGALAKAQGAMGAAKMDSINPFLKNKYADLGSVIQAAKKPLSDNGLSYTQHPAVTDSHVTVTTILMHLSGEWIESEISLPLDGGKGLSLAQSMGAIITYLRRYTLSAILGIYADEDMDGNKPAPKAQAQTVVTPQEKKIIDELYPEEHDDHAGPTMTLETAQAVTGSDGVKYGDRTVEQISHAINAIAKKLTAPDLTTEKREELEYKRDAMRVILQHGK